MIRCVSDAEARMQDHDAYDLIEEQFNRELDGSLGPTGPDSLFGYVADMTLPSGAVVVDAGCGEGEDAIELGTRYGFRVTGVDPVPRCVHVAQRNVRSHTAPGPHSQARCLVELVRGSCDQGRVAP
jgi:2-polyprenyl-3-methyl-5-hydroxy-6-metoxy-1,4-benzoquinol methylase